MSNIFKFILYSFIIFVYFIFPNNTTHAVSFDSPFGINGKVMTAFGYNSHPFSMKIQADGKIILVGYTSNGSNIDWAITRYNRDGSIDTSFGNNGKVVKDIENNDSVNNLDVQADGKIIIGGQIRAVDYHQWAIARLNQNGILDNGFGSSGIIKTFLGNHSVLKKLHIQSEGKILAIGYANTKGNDDVALARYNSDGTLDDSFGGGDGIVTTAIGGSNDRGNAGVIQPDGKIIVFGDFNAGGQDKVFLVRYTPNGSLDTSFGTSGKVITRMGGYDGARDIALQPDGKIVVTGGTRNSGSMDTYVARYNYDGSLDNTFDGDGKAIKSFANNNNDAASSLLLQPDGKIILGGYQQSGSNQDFALRRFNINGSLDTTFGNNGSFVTSISSGTDGVTSIAFQDDGKLLAAGYAHNGTHNDWALVRYNLTDILNIPYFSQNYDEILSPWGDDEYDHATFLGDWTNTTMDRWGCAVTSVAMVLNYHGMTEFENGISIDPGSLNNWLKENKGYQIGKGENGTYSYIVWNKISELSKDLFEAEKTDTKLELSFYNATPGEVIKGKTANEILDKDLEKFPDILRVSNALTSGHYVVVKGKLNNTYEINDPEWNFSDLSYFNNTYSSLVRYIPSSTNLSYIQDANSGTNLSYIQIALNPDVKFLVENQDGKKTGKQYENGEVNVFNEIEDALYLFDPPINNEGENAGTGVNAFHLKYPEDGDYKIIISSDTNEFYTLNIAAFTENGEMVSDKFVGITSAENNEIINLGYSKNSLSISERVVTFNSAMKDVNELWGLSYISDKKVRRELFHLFRKAKHDVKKNNSSAALEKLEKARKIINTSNGSGITQDAYEILLYNINYLKNNLFSSVVYIEAITSLDVEEMLED